MGIIPGPIAAATLFLLAIPAQTPITYRSWSVDGRDFRVAKAGGIELWFNPVAGSKEFAVDIFVVNGGEEAVEILPGRIKAAVIRESENGKKRIRLKTYHPQQYVDLLKRRYHRQVSMQTSVGSPMQSAGSGVALGQHNGSPMDRTERAPLHGEHKVGTELPEPRDIPIPNDQKWAAFSDSLLKPYRIPSHQSYGGLVYLSYQPGDSYHISIPVGATTFEFEFNMPKSGEPNPQ